MELSRNGLNMRQLYIFREVLRRGSTRRAAAAVGISQPAVSQQIKQLEASLGLVLFERSSNRIAPSRQAWELLRSVEGALTAIDQLEGSIAEIRSEAKPSVAISAPSIFGFRSLPNVATAVRKSANFSLRAMSGSHERVREHVLCGEADLGIARLPLDPSLFEWRPLATARNVCLFHPSHRFSALDEVTARDLVGEPIIDIDPHFAMHQMNINELRYRGHEPDILVEYDETGHEVGYVAAGLGVSITNEVIAREYAAFQILARPFTPSGIYHYVVIWQKGKVLTNALQAAVDAIMKAFGPEMIADKVLLQ